MPKEGFSSITIPEEVEDRISEFIEGNKGIVNTKSQAITHAWQLYEGLFNKYKNPRPVRIGNNVISHNHPVFFIAEIGINHNGDLNAAKKLIDLAVEKGCDAVKFQKRVPDLVVPEHYKNKLRETPWGELTYLDYKKKIEFEEEEFKEINRYCMEKGIMWFASVWDIPSIAFMEKFNTPCYKIPSAALTDSKLLKEVKKTGRPVIISTGMSTMQEIEKALSIIGEENTILLQCTSVYPCKDEHLDVNVIKTFRKKFNCPIGYSGHEPGYLDGVIACSAGACVVEKHITLDHSMWGTDQASSLDPSELEECCKSCKRTHIILGSNEKRFHESERSTMDKLRKNYE